MQTEKEKQSEVFITSDPLQKVGVNIPGMFTELIIIGISWYTIPLSAIKFCHMEENKVLMIISFLIILFSNSIVGELAKKERQENLHDTYYLRRLGIVLVIMLSIFCVTYLLVLPLEQQPNIVLYIVIWLGSMFGIYWLRRLLYTYAPRLTLK